jgi:8-amino-7-oxononanoate synthase
LKGTEDCVLFSSGYLANLGSIGTLVRRGDGVISDALNHASIVDGCRLSGAQVAVYRHADLDSCEQALRRARAAGLRRLLVVTDGVFSMDGDLAPLPALRQLTRRYDAMLLVDEAHASGVVGKGRGATAHFGLDGQIELIIGTCSKALGALGGFAAGPRRLCDLLRNRARSFVFDTALPPMVVAAILRALDIVESEPERGARVCSHAQRLARAIAELGYRVSPPDAGIVPVLVGESGAALALSDRLRRYGVLATAIRPPTVPPGTARIRLCPMATHTTAQIDQVVAAFAAARCD